MMQFEEKHTVDTYLSFFNLAIELLLEGLEGAPACRDYLFHCERGYGTDYFTDVSEGASVGVSDCDEGSGSYAFAKLGVYFIAPLSAGTRVMLPTKCLTVCDAPPACLPASTGASRAGQRALRAAPEQGLPQQTPPERALAQRRRQQDHQRSPQEAEGMIFFTGRHACC